MHKIVDFKDLSKLVNHLSKDHKVLVGGCFDILHLGHVRFLKAAKKYGRVIVALESDETLKKHKGHLRPIHKQNERAEVLANLEAVDFVLLLPYFTSDQEYFDLVKLVHPHFIAITQSDPLLKNKRQQANAVGAEIIVIPKISTPSTTQLAKLLKIE